MRMHPAEVSVRERFLPLGTISVADLTRRLIASVEGEKRVDNVQLIAITKVGKEILAGAMDKDEARQIRHAAELAILKALAAGAITAEVQNLAVPIEYWATGLAGNGPSTLRDGKLHTATGEYQRLDGGDCIVDSEKFGRWLKKFTSMAAARSRESAHSGTQSTDVSGQETEARAGEKTVPKKPGPNSGGVEAMRTALRTLLDNRDLDSSVSRVKAHQAVCDKLKADGVNLEGRGYGYSNFRISAHGLLD
jgi:hypothetical protein